MLVSHTHCMHGCIILGHSVNSLLNQGCIIRLISILHSTAECKTSKVAMATQHPGVDFLKRNGVYMHLF